MPVLVAGGTGVLGTAVVRELLASDYEVAATWIVESEHERLASEPVELDPGGSVRPRAGGGGRDGCARPRSGGEPGGRLQLRPARARDRPRGLRAHAAAERDARLPARARGDAAHDRARRRRVRRRLRAPGAAAVLRGRRLHQLEGGGARPDPGARRRVQERRHPLQRDPAERDRHAREPRGRCPTPTTRSGCRPRRSRRSSASSSPTTRRPPAAPPCRSTGARSR